MMAMPMARDAKETMYPFVGKNLNILVVRRDGAIKV